MEFSKIVSSHPMTTPTLLMLLESHSLSIKTPITIPNKVIHKSITIGATVVVILPIIPNLEPFNNKTIKELPPTVQSFDPKSDLVHDPPNVFNPPPQLSFILYEYYGNDARYEQAANGRYWKIPACYDDDDDDYAFAITPNEPVNSLNNDFYSSDDQSYSDEDFLKEIYLNPLFDEEIIPMKIDPHHFNAESDLIESLRNHDSSIIISLKIDSLFDEFAGELTLLKSIPSEIDETDCYPEEETHFIKRLLIPQDSSEPSNNNTNVVNALQEPFVARQDP
nr:hypothetical protein [Tanacetum cinerariifolium]